MINIKIRKLIVPSKCGLCGEAMEIEKQHVETIFSESGHMNMLNRFHMYCADDFADTFQSEITRRNAAELKERDNPPPVGPEKK